MNSAASPSDDLLENVEISERCLTFFIDDTGHEEFKGDRVYGLAGCGALGRDLESHIRSPWREIRRRVTGSTEGQLPAQTFPEIASPDDMEAVAAFFGGPFWRVAAITTTETLLCEQLNLMQTMKGALQARIDAIVEQTLCKEVAIVFESSHRTDRLLQEEFRDFLFFRGEKRIPCQCYFMEKKWKEPALEVADFVVHAAGRQARGDLSGRGPFERDFRAVFHAHDGRLTSFNNVERVWVGAPTSSGTAI